MENVVYDRQRTLPLIPLNAPAVIGCGGVGAWVAILLAMTGTPKLYLYDDDVLELTNFNRIPICPSAVGQLKVEAVKQFILGLRPGCEVYAIPLKLTGGLLVSQAEQSDVLFECTDWLATQLEVYEACRKAGRLFVRAGYDGSHITVTNSVPDWGIIDEKMERDTYAIAPSWVVPAATVAALAISNAMLCRGSAVALDLATDFMPKIAKARRRAR